MEAEAQASSAGRVWRADEAELVELTAVEGQPLDRPAQVRVLAEADSMLVLEVTMTGESPPHVHAHDSVGYVVDGRVRMSLGDENWDLAPGDSFYHPPGVTHQMIALDDPSTWIEIKSPPARTWQS